MKPVSRSETSMSGRPTSRNTEPMKLPAASAVAVLKGREDARRRAARDSPRRAGCRGKPTGLEACACAAAARTGSEGSAARIAAPESACRKRRRGGRLPRTRSRAGRGEQLKGRVRLGVARVRHRARAVREALPCKEVGQDGAPLRA